MRASRLGAPLVALALALGGSAAADAAIALQKRAAAPGPSGAAILAIVRKAASGRAPVVTNRTPLTDTKVGLLAPPISAAMARAVAIRQAQADAALRGLKPPASADLAATQQFQNRNYFCGPATVSEMLAQVDVSLSQLAAARELRTTPAGTDWSNRHGYPVPAVLNANQHQHVYVAVPLPWTPNARQIRIYQADLLTDVGLNKAPIAGNAYEVPGGPHLVGHPLGATILHWFDIRGCSASGLITDYEDSVHGAPAIAWAGSVPAYSSLPSATIVDIVGARGYVW